MTKQLRDSKGRFLPKDAHIEDIHPELYTVLRAPLWDDLEEERSADDWTPPKKAHKALWLVIIGYTAYLALCFGAGVLGALVGVKL